MNSTSGADATSLPAMDFDSAAAPRRQLGTLAVRSENRVAEALPLSHVQIAARVGDRVAQVSIRQTRSDLKKGKWVVPSIPTPLKPRTLADLTEGVQRYVRRRHASR
jgi:hypothetical protein